MGKLTKREPNESMNVWIEIPLYQSDEECKEAAEKVNRMLNRLNCGAKEKGQRFHFMGESDRRGKHYVLISPSGSYKELADRGEWFNLDFLGREHDDPDSFKWREGEK